MVGVIIVCSSDTTSINAIVQVWMVLLSVNITINQGNQWIAGCFEEEIHFFAQFLLTTLRTVTIQQG